MSDAKRTIHDNNLAVFLSALSRYRILSLRQVDILLTGRRPDVKHLQKARIIHLWQAPSPTGAMQHLVALARRGADLLASHEGKEVREVPYLQPAETKRSLFTLEHSLCLTELGLTLERLSRQDPDFKLLRFETAAAKIGDAVRFIREGELYEVPLVADAFLGVAYGQREHWFLVEVDRGTVTLPRMRKKFLGYRHWWRHNGPWNRFGVRNLRLLVLTSTPSRLKRLQRVLTDVSANQSVGFVWLSLLSEVSLTEPRRLLAPIWHKGGLREEITTLFQNCSGP
ncbi:MAG: replication-relaxation family protein [Acidobacteriia bacterium]|nr:replication-relaxation family protein [Terriglobia bacterium]